MQDEWATPWALGELPAIELCRAMFLDESERVGGGARTA